MKISDRLVHHIIRINLDKQYINIHQDTICPTAIETTFIGLPHYGCVEAFILCDGGFDTERYSYNQIWSRQIQPAISKDSRFTKYRTDFRGAYSYRLKPEYVSLEYSHTLYETI